MLHLRDLRVQIQQRRNRIHRTDHEYFNDELLYTFQFLNKSAYIRNLMTTIEASTDVDFSEWQQGLEDSRFRGVEFPRTEEGKAKVCLNILKQCVDENNNAHALNWAYYFSAKSNFNESLAEFTAAVIDPFFNYLDDRIDETSNVLYLIERFKLKVEWFMQEELYGIYKNNTPAGERMLDKVLRAYLFDGGIDYPFSQPESPSGKADVVALLDPEDPLVLEVKLFDPSRSKGKSNLAQGFHQVLRYASDYNQNIGYLVIFNCSDGPLVVSDDDLSVQEFPTRISSSGKSIFVVPVDINPTTASASKENPTSRQIVTFNDLISK